MYPHTTLKQILLIVALLSTTQGQLGEWFDACMNDWECSGSGGYKCINSRCYCPLNTHYSGFACRNDSVTGVICKSDADCKNFKGTACIGPANRSTCACRESWKTIHIYTFECVDSKEPYVFCDSDTECMMTQTCEVLYTGYRICMNKSISTGDYYKKCTGDWECSDTFKCIGSYCLCPATTGYNGVDCQKQGDTLITCMSDADCKFYNGTACIGQANRSTCACPHSWQIMNTHTFECVDRGLRESCDNDTHCSMGLKCRHYYGDKLCINETDGTGDYRKYCMGDWECSSPFKCIGSYCDCPSKTTYSIRDCRSDSDSMIKCQSDDHCKFYNGTACIATANRSTCACPYPWQKINRWTLDCVNRELYDDCENDTDCMTTTKCVLMSSGVRQCMNESFNNHTARLHRKPMGD
ncbi:hypothetical protein DPMN_133107 [Dreissena polymorpha]|uniref:Uncharacterized protein n=1 Tax=Dreissena polymorpha TaxID=45954 RepID=A0A9D4J9G7_DREPO|nr:hypothetical protein DPMN_133107 [Dreissena polymorpha]